MNYNLSRLVGAKIGYQIIMISHSTLMIRVGNESSQVELASARLDSLRIDSAQISV